ncbi:MAG: hypothetical protein WBG86_07595 [Polyangiales bacterium]
MKHNESEGPDAEPRSWLHGATVHGKRPARSRDFLFLGGRKDQLMVVGREIRDEWSGSPALQEPAVLRTFANIAVDFLPLPDEDADTLGPAFNDGFRGIVEETQAALQEEAGLPALALTMAHARGRYLYVGHVGDSRCYLAANGELRRLTEDHTYAPQPPDRPLVSDPALSKKLSNVVGGFSDDLVIHTAQIELPPASLVLLCTAGISRVLADDDLRRLLSEHEGVSMERLCQAVLEASERTLDGADRTVACAKFP